MKRIILPIIFTLLINLTFGQNKQKPKPVICSDCGFPINGKAICLPKPKYPETAKAVRASGEVQVQLLIDENGNVVSASAITGHPFLKESAEKAAKQARFEPVSLGGKPIRVTGVIVYKFAIDDKEPLPDVLSDKPEQLGIVNSYASYLPMPKLPPTGTYKVSKESSIGVQVKVELQTGEVVEATAIYGHPLFRKPAEDAALQAKFNFKDRLFCSKFGIGVLDYKVKDFIDFKTNLIKKETRKLPIINGMATYLPKPEYPQRAKEFCISGKVEIEVLVNENGNVIEAKAISGDKLLIDSSIKAVKNAKFRNYADAPPVKIRGIIVYNFAKEKNCIFYDKAVNNRAIYLPKPLVGSVIHPKHLRLSKDEIVKVEIIVDEQGTVTDARAVSGHPLLRQVCEYAARKTKFSAVNDVGRIKVRAILVYTIKPNGEVEM